MRGFMYTNEGRRAGSGVSFDRYDEESNAEGFGKNGKLHVKLPHENAKHWASLSGECIIIVPAKKVVDNTGN